MAINQRALRWLRGQLPVLVAHGAIEDQHARAIENYYAAEEKASSFGLVLLASIGAAFTGAGIILLIAHNWDELSRPVRTAIAFLPLLVAQALGLFVLLRRDRSVAWRESVAIFDLAAVAAAISLVSQTYQILGSFSDFMRLWLLLSVAIIYIFRSTLAAAIYIIGTVVWLQSQSSWFYKTPETLLFWLWLALILPFCFWLYRRARFSNNVRALLVLVFAASAIGLGFTADFTRAALDALSFAGLTTLAYLCGVKFFQLENEERLSALAILGGLSAGICATALTFQGMWHVWPGSERAGTGAARVAGIAIQLFFPVVALLLAAKTLLQRRPVLVSVAIALLPFVAALAWGIASIAPPNWAEHDSPSSLAAAIIFDLYALALGVELLARGVRAQSLVRANFGLLVLAALALARFFDSDLGFVPAAWVSSS